MANYTRFQLRGDTKANWLSANPVLADREPALETDTNRYKIGDGVSTYSQLSYGRNTGEYASLYNVTSLYPLPSGFYEHSTAILAIPSGERTLGLIITYETASGVWYTERFIGTDIANWGVAANWEKLPDAGDLAQLRSDLNEARSEIVSSGYKSHTQINSNLSISSAYIDGSGLIVSIDTNNYFSVDIYPVFRNKVYAIKCDNSRINGPYPWFSFSSQLLTIGDRVDKIIRESDGETNESFEMFFRPINDGYIYIARVSDQPEVLLYNTNDLTDIISSITGDFTNLPTGISTPFEQRYTIFKPIEDNCNGASVSFDSSADVMLGWYSLDSNVFTLKKSLYIDSSIKKIYVDWEMKQGDYIALLCPIIPGGIKFVDSPSATIIKTIFYGKTTLDNQLLNSDLEILSGYDFAFRVNTVVNQLATVVSNKLESINSDITKLQSGLSNRVGLIRNTDFRTAVLPSGWNNAGGFIPSETGVSTPLDGGINASLEYIQYSNLDADCITWIIEMSQASSFYLTRHHLKYANQLGGHVVKFDFANKQVILYAATLPGVLPTIILKSYNIPYDFVSGEYVITMWRWAEIEVIRILGAGESIELIYDTRTNQESTGIGFDKYGVVFLSGNFSIKNCIFSSPLSATPDLLIVGDSIANADTIRTQIGGGFTNRWAGLIAKQATTSIWALGGNTSNDVNRDLNIITSIFKPKKVIYAIMTNDNNYSNWVNNCIAFTTAFENIGAEVIYTMGVLRSDYEVAHSQIREYIRNSGHRYIDFCAATSVDGLCLTHKDGIFNSDNLHPNQLGHKIMYNAVISAIPDLVSF